MISRISIIPSPLQVDVRIECRGDKYLLYPLCSSTIVENTRQDKRTGTSSSSILDNNTVKYIIASTYSSEPSSFFAIL